MPSVRLLRMSILIKFIRVSIDLLGAPQKLKQIQIKPIKIKKNLHVSSRNVVSCHNVRRPVLLDVIECAVSILWLPFKEQKEAIIHAYEHE